MEMKKRSSNPKNTKRNGKGDSPRNNSSKNFKQNFERIDWRKKKRK
jgi:hypothetical protein